MTPDPRHRCDSDAPLGFPSPHDAEDEGELDMWSWIVQMIALAVACLLAWRFA